MMIEEGRTGEDRGGLKKEELEEWSASCGTWNMIVI